MPKCFVAHALIVNHARLTIPAQPMAATQHRLQSVTMVLFRRAQ